MEALGAVPAYLTKKIQVAVLHESFTSQSKTSAESLFSASHDFRVTIIWYQNIFTATNRNNSLSPSLPL